MRMLWYLCSQKALLLSYICYAGQLFLQQQFGCTLVTSTFHNASVMYAYAPAPRAGPYNVAIKNHVHKSSIEGC